MINSGHSTPVDSTRGNISAARTRIRTLLTALESSAGAFPPLASAVKSLTTCFDIFEVRIITSTPRVIVSLLATDW